LEFKSETAKVRQYVQKYLDGKEVILDIGCGTVEKITPAAIGIDMRFGLADIVVNPADIYHLEKSSRLLKQCMGERADVVFSSHCLEHLADFRTVLSSWTQLLKKDGLLILYLPDERYYDNFRNPEHVHSWNRDEWMEICIPDSMEVLDGGLDVGPNRYSFWVVLGKKRKGSWLARFLGSFRGSRSSESGA